MGITGIKVLLQHEIVYKCARLVYLPRLNSERFFVSYKSEDPLSIFTKLCTIDKCLLPQEGTFQLLKIMKKYDVIQ